MAGAGGLAEVHVDNHDDVDETLFLAQIASVKDE